jgi:DNA replication protein DnaC
MAKWEELLYTCQIPSNLFKVSFDRSRPAVFLKGDMGQLTAFRDGFLSLRGPVGRGKTHFAVCIARDHLIRLIKSKAKIPPASQRFAPVWFSESVEILDEIKRDFDRNKRECLDFYKDHPFLIIDDLGSEKDTEWSKETIYSIINSRYKENLTTVITTNADTLQDKVMSRLKSGVVIEFGGDDQRGK